MPRTIEARSQLQRDARDRLSLMDLITLVISSQLHPTKT
jgi:hypothetical protein